VEKLHKVKAEKKSQKEKGVKKHNKDKKKQGTAGKTPRNSQRRLSVTKTAPFFDKSENS
jgi:hypothetical protein